MTNLLRKLRGAVGNAVVWGGAWFAGTLALYSVLKLTGIAHGTWGGALGGALRAGIMGGIAGTAFSTFIGLRYHGRRLSEIRWWRFGIGGAIVTGLFVPGFIIVARLLSGDPFLDVSSLVSNGIFGAVFGGVAAGGSMKLAQLALGSGSREQPDLLEDGAPR